jgi:glycosyltransferase involved in cell wall biosynthesis
VQPLRIGLVVPRFHENVWGGAELHARWLAEHLASAGHDVTVLTTCVLDGTRWRNELPRGEEQTNEGYCVRRYQADRIRLHEWAKLDMAIRMGSDLSLEEEEERLRMGGASAEMERDLVRRSHDFDVLLGIPYMAATTYFAAKAAPERFCLIPCLHDEPFARLGYVDRLFTRSVGALFNSWPERDLAQRLHPLLGETALVGLGFERPAAPDPDAFRAKYRIHEPFAVFVGRLESDKNVPLLLDYFVRFKQRNHGPLKLLLVGHGDTRLPRREDVQQITIDWSDRDSMLAASSMLVQPSQKESLSIVTMQAWLCGRPVLAHERSAVVRDHCVRSGGGLWFDNYVEFEAMLDHLLADERLASELGRNGRAYVEAEYSWPAVLERFHTAIRRWGLVRAAGQEDGPVGDEDGLVRPPAGGEG